MAKNMAKKNKKDQASRSVTSGHITARPRQKASLKNKKFRRNLLASIAAILAVMIIVPLVAFFTAYSVTKVPEPEELVNNQVSYINFSDGETELARIIPPEGNRNNVGIAEMPVALRNAVLAAEDRDFYDNPGFSITGFARAAFGQLVGRSGAGGGSTITQQYVKNALVGDEYSLTRKAKELVISAKMAREWSKDEILEAYLNTIYFGRNAYGVAAAAQAYFGKPVGELSVEESAVLAASIQAPSNLDPWTNREDAEARWNYVLDGMVTIGALDQAGRAAAVYPEVQDPAAASNANTTAGPNGLIKTRVLEELEEAGISEDQVNTGGLRITTTIDATAQNAAIEQVRSSLQGLQEGMLGAVVSVDPRNGGIKAWYGGEDPVGFDYANGALQTGSTFKIIALAAYLNQGGSIYDQFDSSPVNTLIGDHVINNVDNQTCGSCAISEALRLSLNTSFIRLVRAIDGGAQAVADMAHRLGVAESLPGIEQTLTENGGEPFEGIALGQYQSRPLDMASALATLSNKGKYFRPHFVQKVENADGDVLLDNTNMEGDQVIKEEVAEGVITAMQPIAAYSNGKTLAGGRPSAAKTGTVEVAETSDNKDAWMIGSTPQLSTAVWLGTADGQPIYNEWGGVMYGSATPATIWKNTMDNALQNEPIESFDTSGYATRGTGGSSAGSSSGSTGDSGSPSSKSSAAETTTSEITPSTSSSDGGSSSGPSSNSNSDGSSSQDQGSDSGSGSSGYGNSSDPNDNYRGGDDTGTGADNAGGDIGDLISEFFG